MHVDRGVERLTRNLLLGFKNAPTIHLLPARVAGQGLHLKCTDLSGTGSTSAMAISGSLRPYIMPLNKLAKDLKGRWTAQKLKDPPISEQVH